MTAPVDATATSAWAELSSLRDSFSPDLREWFAIDPRRAERLSFEQALAAFTRGAAHAGFADDRIGALEPGKWADFILVDRDVGKVDPQALARTHVLETWVAGKKVWERPSGAGAERGR